MTIEEKLSMLLQMRWVAAQRATGGRNDEATAELIRTHQAVLALDAVLADGVPEQKWNIDIDGHPLDPAHHWNKP